MGSSITDQEVKAIILRELPAIVGQDEQVRELILRLSREHFADKSETERRFDQMLEELRREREEETRRWEEENRRWEEHRAEDARRWEEHRAEDARKWEEQNRKWEEHRAEDARKWEEQNRKWEEHRAEDARKWEEQNRKWEEQNQKWEEQNRRWWENQKAINEMLASIKALARKHDITLGALGARWGLNTEESFRSALKGILEESFGVEVVRVVEWDDEGEVFGHPDQIELDLMIRNGMLILGEIKSSMSRSDMYAFDRKTRFYERKHQQKANRRIVISPMVEEAARQVADRLGIEVYSYAEDVSPEPMAENPSATDQR